MEDLTPEQIIQIGQQYFPEMDAQKIMEVFEQFKELMPESSNLEIAQVIKMTIDENKATQGNPQISGLRDMISKR